VKYFLDPCLFSAAALGLGILASPSPAREPSAPDNTIYQGQCKLIVDNNTYIDGPCEIQAWGPDAKRGFDITATVGSRVVKANGSASGIVWNKPQVAARGKKVIGVDGKPADYVTDTPIGRSAKRDGECWVNRRARICATAAP